MKNDLITSGPYEPLLTDIELFESSFSVNH